MLKCNKKRLGVRAECAEFTTASAVVARGGDCWLNSAGTATVYRVLKPCVEKVQAKQCLGWRGDRLRLQTREGTERAIEWSNQVWQCDHTHADVLIVDQSGSILGRPWLTTVIDSYSQCIMGFHLGFDAPSASVAGLALRPAILPKQYSGAYELQQMWGTYGIPQYLYTDGGKDFRSQ